MKQFLFSLLMLMAFQTAQAYCVTIIPTGRTSTSNSIEFSIDDIKSTMIMQKTLKLHGVKLTDHILVCGEKAVSMAENKKYTF